MHHVQHPLLNNSSEIKLFCGQSSKELARKIATAYGQDLGKIKIKDFSDGEMQPIINESVRGAYFYYIQSTPAPAKNWMELLLTIDAAKRASAGYIIAVIPYFGYARQDRKDKPRVPISAKLMADLLQTAGVHRIMTMDFHADQIQGFFDVPVDHLESEAVFMPYLEENNLTTATFASPDVGGVKRARAYSKHFGTNLVICDKYREKANEVAGMTLIGDVKNQDVILVDDLVDTAGTLCRAADLIVQKGAKSVKALCTHPVLSGDAYNKIVNSKLEELIVCDTIPLQKGFDTSKITVLTAAKLFATAIRNVHENRSISKLFVTT